MGVENEAGFALARAPPGEEIMITGMSGRFPESDNVYQYKKNIYNKMDMITGDNRRWLPTNPEVPHRTGKINFLEHLDAGYFGLHYYEANQMDPMIRIGLEKAYETICDAGYNVKELDGARCGVFIGSCFSESEEVVLLAKMASPNFGVTGCNRSMTSQKISHFFNLLGPSHTVDTACSSSLYALEHAYRAIREGQCDSALVGGVSLCLNALTSLQFARLGVLSEDGRCKPFDEEANGYARSESVSMVFLQKAKDARRIYAQVMHAKTNSDGYKEEGITFPSSQMQKDLLDNTYRDCQLDPALIDFLEAHATGTKVGDPEEMTAMDQVFCPNRQRPLIVGSIKSYLGHAEGASGMCSLVKVILGMEDDCILPSINFKSPRQSIKALVEGRMTVAVDVTPWPKRGSGLVAINSFGFGGSNAHVILKKFEQEKVNGGIPDDDLPRLMCVSGRTRECLQSVIDDIGGRPLDVEYCRLIQQVFKDTSFEHPYRGYIVHSKHGELERHIGRCDSKSRVCLLLPGTSEEVVEIGKQLYNFPLFASSVQKIGALLPKQQVDFTDLIKTGECKGVRSLILSNLVTQLAFVDLLRELKVRVNYSAGKSIGEVSAAYANGSLSLEQAAVVGYEISQILKNGPDTDLKSKVPALLNRLRKVVPDAQKLLERLTNSTPLAKRTWSRVHWPKLAVVVLGSEKVQLNGFSYLKVSGLDPIRSVLNVLGSLYLMGQSVNADLLYPPVKWPVSRGTPLISPLIKWNYDTEWFTTIHAKQPEPLGSRVIPLINKEIDWSFLPGHVIDGLTLMPATGYLYMVWETYCKIINVPLVTSRVVFENVKFHKAVNISKLSAMEFKITIGRNTHKFEIGDVDQPIVSGSIHAVSSTKNEFTSLKKIAGDGEDELFYSSSDVYKELRLRGYNYSGAFCSMMKANLPVSVSEIKWENNWIAFMDNMLQAKLLGEDSRSLYVPTFINKLVIDAPKHMEYAKGVVGDEPLLEVHSDQYANIVSSGGIELKQLYATAISRRKERGEPVLESYKFVSFEAALPLRSAVRVLVQIFLENTFMLKVKIVEVAQTSAISPLIQEALNDQPLVKSEISILSNEDLSVPNVKVVNKPLSGESQCAIIVLEQAGGLLGDAQVALKENGMIIVRETSDSASSYSGLVVLSVLQTETERLVLLKRANGGASEQVIEANFDGRRFDWLNKVQSAMKNDTKTILVVQNEPLSGVLGFVNCLRREPGGMHLRCVFVLDTDLRFDLSNPFFGEQLKKGLAINVVKEGVWGTYRHLPLDGRKEVERPHAFCNLDVLGNLSSLNWVEGPLALGSVVEQESTVVQVCSSAINFKDVMVASGRVPMDAFTRQRLLQTTDQGFEYSGTDARGKRVMGMTTHGALASLVKVDSMLTFEVPPEWSMEEAASVPVTYGTVLCSLVRIAKIRPGQTLLIHAGSGGVGQAAINIATYYKCRIFTTVGTKEKRQFIRENFPNIPDTHIGNSRDSSFVQMVLKHTKGSGVDIVLNSLAEEKLKASMECLAPKGCFVEIGKYDLVNNNKLSLSLFGRTRTFGGCMLDLFFKGEPTLKYHLKCIMDTYLKRGAIRPLHYNVFKMDEVEQAYRFMASAKHVGKIIIKVRDEKETAGRLFKCFARFICDPSMTYVIVGGLGGFALELVDWLVLRGGRKFVLVSRSGVRSGYAAARIRIWKSYTAVVRVVTDDVTVEEGCVSLLANAERLAPVDAIFNLAVVLQDGLIENQTEEKFATSLSPKATATLHLDAVSRRFCPRLRHFVVFSSVSCGRGNIGQTNYGMANSIMERICEKRRAEGLPGLAIQWGAIGEVGLVAELQKQQKEIEIGGTLQQRVSSCLHCLDVFLTQDEPVVSSMVVAEKRSIADGAESVMGAIKNIMGITDMKKIGEHATLSEMGMDSMTAVEIKQTLERDCEVFLSAKEIRTLTLAKLKEILSNKMSDSEGGGSKKRGEVLYWYFGHQQEATTPNKPLNSLLSVNESGPRVFLLPGIEGVSDVLEPLAGGLKAHVTCFQYLSNEFDHRIESIAKSLLQYIPDDDHFILVAHSYGCNIALELCSKLESFRKRTGHVILIDGAPEMLKSTIDHQLLLDKSPDSLDTAVLLNLMNIYMPSEEIETHKETLLKLATLEERVDYALKVSPDDVPFSKEYQKRVCLRTCLAMKNLYDYEPNFAKLNSHVALLKPTEMVLDDYDEDYRLQKLCERPLLVKSFEGNHSTVLKNSDLLNTINDIICNKNDM